MPDQTKYLFNFLTGLQLFLLKMIYLSRYYFSIISKQIKGVNSLVILSDFTRSPACGSFAVPVRPKSEFLELLSNTCASENRKKVTLSDVRMPDDKLFFYDQ